MSFKVIVNYNQVSQVTSSLQCLRFWGQFIFSESQPNISMHVGFVIGGRVNAATQRASMQDILNWWLCAPSDQQSYFKKSLTMAQCYIELTAVYAISDLIILMKNLSMDHLDVSFGCKCKYKPVIIMCIVVHRTFP